MISTSDLVFKAVYGRNTKASNAALIALLNRLLEKEKDPIVWLNCENPFSYATYQGEKEIVMDIKVQLSSGQLLDMEMQVDHLDCYINRSISIWENWSMKHWNPDRIMIK